MTPGNDRGHLLAGDINVISLIIVWIIGVVLILLLFAGSNRDED